MCRRSISAARTSTQTRTSTRPRRLTARSDRLLKAVERAHRLTAAMSRLSAEKRVVLSLFAIEGLHHRQIAEILGIPEGTVWSRLSAARKELVRALAR